MAPFGSSQGRARCDTAADYLRKVGSRHSVLAVAEAMPLHLVNSPRDGAGSCQRIMLSYSRLRAKSEFICLQLNGSYESRALEKIILCVFYFSVAGDSGVHLYIGIPKVSIQKKMAFLALKG